MKLEFSAINSLEEYRDCRVMFITGPYNIFNNIVMDKLKEFCNETDEIVDGSIYEEFGLEVGQEVKLSNSINIDTFIYAVRSPSITGRWFCSVELNTLTKKQNEWLKEYIKNPSENGILVLNSNQYKDYRFWLNNNKIKVDKYVHIIQLSFPRRDDLGVLAVNLFRERNAKLSPSALDLFIIRMSSSYDDYIQIIDKICEENLPEGYLQSKEIYDIDYDSVFNSLRGIENFVLDDFIYQIVKPLTSDKPKSGTIVFRMMGYLIEEYGARKLVNLLIAKIGDIIEFRMAINKGYIPIIVNYNVSEAKELIGEDNPISKKSDFQFKKLAQIASLTSLQDWVYMRMILMNVSKFSETSYNKALYSLVARTQLTESRLNNDILIENMNSYDLKYINSIQYQDIDENLNDNRPEIWSGGK